MAILPLNFSIIYNPLFLIPSGTSQRLALEIVRFGESTPLTALKRVERGRYPGLYIAPFVLLPSQCGTLQSTPLGAQRPRWHTDPSLALIPSVTSQRLALEIVRFGESSPLTALKRVERGGIQAYI